MKIKTLTYTGNGSDNRSITGVGFQPSVVLVKRQGYGGGYAVLRTSDMTGDLSKPLSSATALTANLVQALETDGFQVGTDAAVNENAQTYHALCLQAHSADCKLGTYTGNGSDNRSITGVGFQPSVVIVIGDNASQGVIRHAGNTGDASSTFNEGGGGADLIQSLDSDGFTVGTSASVNANGVAYYYVALKNATGYFITNSYTGNGSDNRSITGVGFQPDDVGIHRASGYTDKPVWRPSTLAGDLSVFYTTDGAGANLVQALETDGFQVGTAANVNANGPTYGYWAFKDGDSQGGAASATRMHGYVVG